MTGPKTQTKIYKTRKYTFIIHTPRDRDPIEEVFPFTQEIPIEEYDPIEDSTEYLW